MQLLRYGAIKCGFSINTFYPAWPRLAEGEAALQDQQSELCTPQRLTNESRFLLNRSFLLSKICFHAPDIQQSHWCSWICAVVLPFKWPISSLQSTPDMMSLCKQDRWFTGIKAKLEHCVPAFLWATSTKVTSDLLRSLKKVNWNTSDFLKQVSRGEDHCPV